MGISATLKYSRWITAPIAVFLLTLPALGFVDSRFAPTVAPLELEVNAAHFPEPLVLTKPTTAAEDAALARALATYRSRTIPDDLSSLAGFVSQFPHSGWVPGLLTNIGMLDLHYGYFSGSIVALRRAWDEGKDATEPRARSLVDGAVGKLAWLDASLGHFKELTVLFDEIGSRKVSGSATETLQTAREELTLAQSHPRHLLLCGPTALGSLMLKAGARHEQVRFVHTYNAGPSGTNLADVARLADQSKFSSRLIFRRAGQAVPIPSIVHWRVGHFAAIVSEANGRFEIEDPVFPGERTWVTSQAVDVEASGYFLVPTSVRFDSQWRIVQEAEASTVWGKGPTNGTRPGGAGDPRANPGGGGCPLCDYNIAESSVALTLKDAPVGYSPPIGPAPKVVISYNQREASQPQNFSFFNVSPKWTLNWLSYVTDDPANPGATVSRYLSSGGAFYYNNFNSITGRFAGQDTDGSILILTSQAPVTYQRQLSDGSIETYSQSDGSAAYPRNVFIKNIIDPQGNILLFNYDNQQRLVSLTDAVGRQTILSYELTTNPLLVTKITDPFGRSASLSYDILGRLSSITDIIGLTSRFTYDGNSLVNSLSTPYGTTSFAYTAPGTSSPPRYVQVTDPLGYNEREEWVEPSSIPDSDPVATVPQGMPISLTNQYLTYRNSFHWDKNAYVLAGCTPNGGCDYTKARITHFTHVPPNTNIKGTSVESIKYPLENRIWNTYPGQTSSLYGGSYDAPNATARVLDDGSTQIRQFAYDSSGFYKKIQEVDPLGRTTSYSYPNHVDLAAITQITAGGVSTNIAQFTYNIQHRPIIYTDAASQTSTFGYNLAGQLTSVSNALDQKTKYQYDASANLLSIVNENNAISATFTYDSADRVATYTDSEGWTASYNYDNADRVTRVTYPDGTTDIYTYNSLDLASYRDRLNRTWAYSHDANRRLTGVADPLGHSTSFGYNGLNELTSLTDGNNNTTTWTYDVEGRLHSKQYADNSTVIYIYENTIGRLKSVTDALGQTKQYVYAQDDQPSSISYINARNPTPNVGFAYDLYFPRPMSMTDGNGTTQYNYVPVGTIGALQLQQETSPLPNSAIVYSYDALGRLTSRAIEQSGAQTYQYDAIGRIVSDANDLGTFALSYLGQTSQITRRQLAGSTFSTSWSYLPNSDDRRLAAINNIGFSISQYSNFQFTSAPENLITSITEMSDSPSVYPSVLMQTANYNNLNQLTNLSGQALNYDTNGNLLSDGQRTYSWDAENRLVGIHYSNQTGKATSFSYDGLSRRTAITSTFTGGESITTSYLWCGMRLCQARDVLGRIKREYLDEGEASIVPNIQNYLYGLDQIGSVVRVFSSASSTSRSYDPYGVDLSVVTSDTDFNYAGTVNQLKSGLYLTKYRIYDPSVGRWISRDPYDDLLMFPEAYVFSRDNPIIRPFVKEVPSKEGILKRQLATTGFAGQPIPDRNLYNYVDGRPVVWADPRGLVTPTTGAPWSMWISPGGRTCRFFDGNGNADFDIDLPGHHFAGGEWHGWHNGVRGLPNPFGG